MISCVSVQTPPLPFPVGSREEHKKVQIMPVHSITDAVNPASDIDLLVEFEPGKEPGLIGMGQLEAELSSLLGRRVDLRTAQDLSRYFRDEVLRTAEVQYAH